MPLIGQGHGALRAETFDHVIVATGHEWRRPDLVKPAATRFIVPINFPKVPKMPSDSDWERVSLDQLRAWDWAPDNPVLLQKNGLEIALTTHGLKDKKTFRENLAKVIERGLAKRDALAALTTTPAKLTGAADQLGTVEAGKLANLVVVEGDYFDPKAKLKGVWIEGRWNTLEPENLAWIDKKKEDDEEKDDEKQAEARTGVKRFYVNGRWVDRDEILLVSGTDAETDRRVAARKK